jgi:hypothetical protein
MGDELQSYSKILFLKMKGGHPITRCPLNLNENFIFG